MVIEISDNFFSKAVRVLLLTGLFSLLIGIGGFIRGDPSVGALSIHCYDGKPENKFKEGLKFARELELPLFIVEMGTFFMS